MKSKRWNGPLILVGLMQQQLQDEISGRQIRRDYTLPINVDDDEDDDDDLDPKFTIAARASRCVLIRRKMRDEGAWGHRGHICLEMTLGDLFLGVHQFVGLPVH
ncbi:hypothetical protein Taro_045176 [Colocasia esculenta]|uniref:Uncharacterized protein n=1 Tax=Colocasia esculenta TaxID=4460 RepID=A0A843X687_COLES|nr:hypothetical protein [Colocasia esculenta]